MVVKIEIRNGNGKRKRNWYKKGKGKRMLNMEKGKKRGKEKGKD